MTIPLSNLVIIRLLTLATVVIAFSGSQAFGQITLGQIDDFSVVSAAGWSEGASSPNPPAHTAEIGADGLPGHLVNTSDGGGAGGRLQMFNGDLRWTGDYLAAGVSAIELSAANFSDNGTDINLRVAFDGAGGFFVSDAIVVEDGSGFTDLLFELDSLSHVAASGGTGVLADTLSDVTLFEILSAEDLPTVSGLGFLQGDNIVADLRIDNITAVGVPEPATTALALLGLAGIAARRRR